MADFLTKLQRSALMSRVRSKGNLSTELRFAALLRAGRISGWRRHYPLFGRPDFVFLTQRVAVFTDGCFWHRCPHCYSSPKSNRAFWKSKVKANVARSKFVNAGLRRNGWRVLRFWEHELTHNAHRCIRKLRWTLIQNNERKKAQSAK
ncbi:MAG: very short patch repair endonuclease [Verrucomicrobiia bacterium]